MNRKMMLFPYLLVLFEMVTYLSSDMYLPALPTVMRDLGISHQQAQFTLTVWFLGSISVQLILGPLSDRYGRKGVLCFGGVLFVLSTLGCALAPNFHTLLIARFIQGSGICFMAVPGYASIHESFEQKEAIKLLALMASIAIIAPALGPLLGSAFLIFTNWRWIFGFLVIWSAISVGLLIWYMPETLPPEKRHPIYIKNVFGSYARCLTNVKFIISNMIFGLLFCGFITWIVAGPFIVIDQFKESPVMFSIYQAVIFTSYTVANQLVKKLVDKIDINKLIRFGLLITLVSSILGVVITYLFPNLLLGLIAIYVAYAFGTGFAFAPLNRLTVEASKEPMGYRMALFSTSITGFATLSSVLVSVFYHHTMLPVALIIFSVVIIAFALERLLNR